MAKKPSKTPPGSGPDSEAGTPKPTPSSTTPPAPVMNTPDVLDDASSSVAAPVPRAMRLKVLYSLDDLLPNCLARAKEVAYVRVAHIDESTPIGFVDLKTCVLNIVYSSPEIMHHHGCDYSVYSYDYSEPDTPMTGLGLLSWVLSLPSLNGQQPDPDAIDPAQANRLVTGRVQQNLFGLFATDVKETLEVRMRLCRVPTLKQTDYLHHMNQYSQLARNLPPGADPAAVWANGIMAQGGVGGQPGYMQQHSGAQGGMPTYPPSPYMPAYPNLGPYQNSSAASLSQSQATQTAAPPASNLQVGAAQGASGGVQKVEGASPAALSQPMQAQGAIASAEGRRDEAAAGAEGAQPATKKRKVAPRKPTGRPRGRPRLTDIREPKPDVQPPSRDSVPQDPAPSEAAPPTIKQAPTPSSAAPSPSSISITSNTKATAHSFQFGADSSAASPQPSLSQVTPLPQPSSAAPSPVALVHATTDTADMPPSIMSPANEDADIEMTHDVPEITEDANADTAQSPRDSDIDSLFMGSSPPPSHSEMSAQNPSSPADTSPMAVRESCKEFLAGHLHHTGLTACSDGPEYEPSPLPEEPTQDGSSPSEKASPPGDIDDQISTNPQPLHNPPGKRGRPRKTSLPRVEQKKKVSTKVALWVPEAPATSPGELKERETSQLAVSTPALMLPPGLNFPTLPSKENEIPASRKRRSSEAGSDVETAPAKRGSTTALVRARIQRQMLEKIKAGEMPTYCMHCGAIETPTWRKAKVPDVDPVTGDELEKEVTLCNPCGLWHHNHGTMRPEQFWARKKDDPKDGKPKKKWKKKPSVAKQGLGHSNVVRSTSFSTPVPSSPPGHEDKYNPRGATSPPAPSGVEGAEEWDQAVNKNLRRIQSSPCGLGTVSHPISLLSPDQKTRRKLFPDAKKTTVGLDGEPAPEGEEDDAKAEEQLLSPDEPVGSPEMEKENHPPPVDVADMDLDWERELEQTLLKANAEVEEQGEEQGESSTNPTDEVEVEGEEEEEEEGMQSDATIRPSTPEKQSTPPPIDFKTPIRLTPLLASINVDSPSFWKSGMLGVTTPGKIASAHPTPTPSKLLMGMNMVSPATGEIMLEFLNEWSKVEEMAAGCTSPTPARGPDEDNEDDGTDAFFSELNLEIAEKEMGLTSEGNAMPSSPPAMFNLYDEEPGSLVDAVSSSLFSDILPTSPGNAGTYHLDLGDLGGDQNKQMDEPVIDLNFDFDEALVVDFSDFVPPVAAKAAAAADSALVAEKVPAQVVASEKKESSEDDSSSTDA
ncbi:hypothetical protein DRE_02292 [Drechslerella stenobrocha 248]|uniref:GATA-type domain-containing protein n=1 Tax=Drechslerella stenobrocha 248 TaxID=1043628 RepID=W7I782_9PEZI|nr:hypothetical protein DRE_02292 [Drechslerella stenobrocha 248]